MTEITADIVRARRRFPMRLSLIILGALVTVLAWIDLPYYRDLWAFESLKKIGGHVAAKTDEAWIARWNGRIHTDVRVLMGDSSVRDEDLQHLKNISSIKAISLHGTPVTNEGLKQLRSIISPDLLKILDLSETKITGRGLIHLSEVNGLAMLDLSDTDFSDDDVKVLAKMKSLEYVSLAGTSISNRGLEQLKLLPNLTSLYLGRTKITDEGLLVIAEMKPLRDLSLAETSVTDAGLTQLITDSMLEKIDLGKTSVTNVLLERLLELENLEAISLKDTQFTQDDIDEIKRRRPRLMVLR